MATSHTILTQIDEVRMEVWEDGDRSWLTVTDGPPQTVRVSFCLTDAVKDRLARIVRDWQFEEEAALHDMEEAAGYPIGQTLAGTFLGIPPKSTGCAVGGCTIHEPHGHSGEIPRLAVVE